MSAVADAPPNTDRPTPLGPRTLRPSDAGLRMTFDDFQRCHFQDGWRFELARGTAIASDIPALAHGFVIMEISSLFALHEASHPGAYYYLAGASTCRIRLPGLASDRVPDQAICLRRPPTADPKPWTRWTPDLVVEVISDETEERDYGEKREEYLRAGVSEH